MSRIATFLFGVIVGAAAVFGSLKYHVLRTDGGVQFIPKLSSTFDETYLDIRNFGMDDWAKHKTVVAAIIEAKREDLLTGAGSSLVRDGVSAVLEGWRRLREGQ